MKQISSQMFDKIYPLSPIQQGLLFSSLSSISENSYVMQNVFTISGKVSQEKLKQAIAVLQEENDVLRTSLGINASGEYVQWISNDIPMEVVFHNLFTTELCDMKDILTEISGYISLSDNKLFRTDFICISPIETKMVWTYHHIILDSISVNILGNRFNEIYSQLDNVDYNEVMNIRRSQKNTVVRYQDYINWINSYDSDFAIKYWRGLLSDYNTIADIRPMTQNNSDSLHLIPGTIALSYEMTKNLISATKFLNCSLEDVVQAAWAVLLHKYSFSDDIVFGKVYHGRPSQIKGCDELVGVFISTIPVRSLVTDGEMLKDLVCKLKEQTNESKENSYCSLSKILNVTSQKKELLKTILMYEEVPKGYTKKQIGKSGINITKEPPAYHTEYQISVSILYDGDQLHINLHSDGSYDSYEIDLILKRLEKILEIISENKPICINGIDISLEDEKVKILDEFNNTDVVMDLNKTMVDLFEEQVKKMPLQTALVFENSEMTYSQLNKMSNKLAHKLRNMGVKPNDFVVIIAKRGFEQIAAVIAILKAGGAYVPISLDYPKQRIQFMINDCKPKAVLVYGTSIETTYPVIDLSDVASWSGDDKNPKHVCDGENLSYVIYTSGTTGNPKGVMVQHSGIISLNKYLTDLYEITDSDKVLQYANLVFDVSVWELSMSLLGGATLVLISERVIADISLFNRFVIDNGITVALIPPLYLVNTNVNNLKALTTGGSASSADVVKHALGNHRYINAYGPTEISVQATHWEYDFSKPIPKSIPIGKPIYNTKAYIMNNGRICGIGVPGVLYIAGIGVTKGYLNLPELTVEKFKPNPFGSGMIYDSGDLARWLPDGNIEFLGRVDDQVKIRGYRIELGDITAHIRDIPNIIDVAVIVREDGSDDDAIFAYVVSEEKIDVEKIKNKLREQMPEYMIPTYIAQIDSIPITKGGKLDKKSLPQINLLSTKVYEAPQNEVELAVCSSFEAVLGVKDVGIWDNFFELGGDSIKALRVVSHMNNFGYEVSASAIMTKFTPATIAATASHIGRIEYEQDDVTGDVIPTPIMRFFDHWNLTNINHFNQDILLEMSEEDEQYLPEVLREIVHHHDILRSEYINGTLRVHGSNESDKFIVFKCINLKGAPNMNERITSEADNLQASLNLNEGPVMKVVFFTLDKGCKLYICIHHLLVDGVSWRILIDDILLGLKQKKSGTDIVLPKKTASFIEWSKSLDEFSKVQKIMKQKPYWENVIANMPKGTLKILKGNGHGYQTVKGALSKQITENLIKNAGKAFHTDINSLLISALVIAVKRKTGQDLLTLCMEGHGREEIHKKINIDRTIGWFTTIYPVICNCSDDLQEVIISTKEMLKKVPDHGIGYGLLYNKLNVMQPTFFFNYLGELDLSSNEILMNQTGLRMSESNKHPEDLAISCVVNKGVMYVEARYDKQLFDGQVVEELLGEYTLALKEITEFCIEVKEIIKTPSDFSAKELTRQELNLLNDKYGCGNIKDICDLTAMQEEMLYLYLKDNRTTCYIVQETYQFSKAPNFENVHKAYKLLMERFDELKTSIVYEQINKPYQIVLLERTFDYEYIDISTTNEIARNELIEKVKADDITKVFHLSEDALFRATYLHVDGINDIMLWSCHHIIMDGWSLTILKDYFEKYYNKLCQGISESVIRHEIQMEKNKSASFSQYVNMFVSYDYDAASSYWSNLLCDYDGDSQIAFSEDAQMNNMESLKLDKWLSETITESLKKTAASLNATINTIVETAWGLLLQRTNFCDDIVFGKTVSGRDAKISGIDKMVGILINTIPVRIKCNQSALLSEVILDVQSQANNSKKYDYYPLSNISELRTGSSSIIGSLIVFENYYDDYSAPDENACFLVDKSYREETNVALNLISGIEKNKLRFSLMFKTTEYTKSDIYKILDRFEILLNMIAINPSATVDEVCLITEHERKLIFEDFNRTKASYPKDKGIIDIFEDQVAKYQHKTAIVADGKTISYSELNARANYWANVLLENGIKRNDYVAIAAEKNIETIIGIYAIIKAGGAYVPIDLKQPADRISFILNDCKPKAILKCESELNANIPIICIQCDENSVSNQLNCKVEHSQDDLGYVIYTSGTTGAPKGVKVTQKNIIKLVINTDYAPLNDNTVILQTGQIAFDASTFEIWGSGLNGGELHLAPEEILLNVEKLRSKIRDGKINTAFFTVTLFNQIIDTDPTVFATMKYLLVGGEKVSETHMSQLHTLYPELVLKNIYGPTETTTFATTYRIDGVRKKIPIGKPISNTQAYVMQGNIICGIGMTGELCIAGDGVSEGYLNNPELTATKFEPNPFGENMMYRTGDLVRWGEDGNIEFIGRADGQIKIHGFRIELGEIEHALRCISQIKNAVATVIEDSKGDKSICAYYVSNEEIESSEIKSKLLDTLPAYMIPTFFVHIDRIIMNRNGKVDKKALPLPKLNSSNEYVAPRNKKEQIICDAFAVVLEHECISIWDDFYDIGGNSIKVIRFINMVEAKTGFRFSVRDVFECKTPASLAKKLNDKNSDKRVGITKAEEKEYYPMSSAQKRVFFMHNLAPESVAYNIALCYKLGGDVNMEKLEKAFQSIIDRHEILRTGFIIHNDMPAQKIFNNVKVTLDYYQDVRSSEIELMERFVQPFNLSCPPLLRMGIVKRNDCYILMIDMHHIVCDGMSLSVFMDEFSTLYNKRQHTSIRQYKDYSEWMNTRDLSVQKEYWIKRFSDELPTLDMPTDYKRPVYQSYKGAVESITLNKECSDFIKKAIRKYNVSEYMIFLSAAMILLSKYSGQSDIVIGSPILTRMNEDTEKMLGMFVNTLAMRGKPEEKKYYVDFLQEIKEDCMDAYEYQEFPFEELVDCIDVKKDFSRNPLFDVLLVMQNNKEANLSLDGVNVEYIELESYVSKFDLKFDICEKDGSFVIHLEYCTDLYCENSAKLLLCHYENLLFKLMLEPEQRIIDYELINEIEQDTIRNKFNNTKKDYNLNQTVVDCFRNQVALHPEKTAIVMETEFVSYAKLDSYARGIEKIIRAKGVKKDELIAILADRNISMIAGILGILYSGAAYVPIDNSFPINRIDYILNDCGAKFALVSGLGEEFGEDLDIEIVDITDISIFDNCEDNVIFKTPSPNDLAYCIYTSGTTGMPKGVLVEHRALINNMLFTKEFFLEKIEEIRVPLFTSHCFDLSMPSIYLPLCFGGVMEIISQNKEYDLSELMNSNKYSFFKMTPSHAKMLLNNKKKLDQKVIIAIGGEILDESIYSELQDAYGDNLTIFNEYGPTETTVFATAYRCRNKKDGMRIPIGKPIANTSVYIMQGDKLCGIGIPGEICIGGDGLARGYLNKPDLTDEKFIINPYNTGKIYRTGDIGRWLYDGNIEYIGRRDEQVKIRGYRIELSGIENSLRELNGIKDVAVTICENQEGEKTICAYYVSQNEISIETIRMMLLKKIPEYMVPARIARIDAIPLTKNGKIDKKALPEIEAIITNEYIEPKSLVERALCKAFEEVLGVKKVGIKDNFFDLGGDSIKAIRIVSKMRTAGFEIKVKQIMANHTVEAISMETIETEVGKYNDREISGEIILTPMLRQFMNCQLEHPECLTQDVMLKLDIDDESVIKRALSSLAIYHDMLRSVCYDGKVIIQKINESMLCAFRTVDLRFETDYAKLMEDECTVEPKSMDLEIGPLMRSILFRLPDGNKLFICIHHISVDAVSWHILLNDLKKAMDMSKNGAVIELHNKTLSFMEWAQKLAVYKKEISDDERRYWKEIEDCTNEAVYMTVKEESVSKVIGAKLDEQSTELLLRNANRAYHTKINDLMLAALGMAVKKTSGQDKILIALEGHGREDIVNNIKTDGTVGWFTSKYPLIIKCIDNVLESIIETKETLRAVPMHGIGYGLLKGSFKGLEDSISFNYLGTIDSENSGNILFNKSMRSESYLSNLTGMIDIDSYVEDGRLQINCNLNPTRTNDVDVKALLKAFLDSLNAIIVHCVNKDEAEKTMSDYSASTLTRKDLSIIHENFRMDEVEDIYELTPLQKGMLYHNVSDDDYAEYVVQHIFRLDKSIEEGTIKAALHLITLKHEVLKTAIFYSMTESPWQIIRKNRDIEYEHVKMDDIDANSLDLQCRLLGESEVSRGFDLEKDSLLRVKCISLGDRGWRLIWSYHHIIVDGWCASVLFGDFLEYCSMLGNGISMNEIKKEILLNKKYRGRYVDYVKLYMKDNKDILSYWKEYLAGYEGSAEIKPMYKVESSKLQMKREGISIDGAKYSKLLKFVSNVKVTLNTVIETAVGITLQKYNHNNDVVLGKVVSGRDAQIEGVESIVGLFVNTIPLRVITEPGETVESLLVKMQQQGIEGVENCRCSLSEIQAATRRNNDLIKVLYAFENYYVNENRIDACGFKIEYEREQTNYAITITAYVENGSLKLDILYNPNEYYENEIRLILNRISKVISWMSENRNEIVDRVDSITKEEYWRILNEFNDTDMDYPRDKTVVELFEKQVALDPEGIAIVDGEKTLSYAQMNGKANQLAVRLRKLGVNPGDFVAVVTERTWETVIGILAILKSGGAYVPMDPDYPDQRKQFILKDCKPKAILTYENIIETAIPVINLKEESIWTGSKENLPIVNKAQDLAYSIYTSGTTGNPKGSLIPHRGIVRLVCNTNYIVYDKDTVFLQTGSMAFDASTMELWGPFINGGKLVLTSNDIVMSAPDMMEYIRKYKVTTMWLTSSLYNQMVQINPEMFDRLKYLMIGGEKLSEKHVKLFKNRKTLVKMLNGYGPTENTTFTTTYLIPDDFEFLPIGKPIANTKVYIMNGDNLCGIGIPGELCTTGDGLSYGYLNRTDLTEEKFVQNPFGAGKMYKTGDIAKWLPDGNIVYMGRMDDQVKIHGFRIEIGEIETAMRQLENIKEAAIIASENTEGDKAVFGYVVADEELDISEIRVKLRASLPHYMIPKYIIQIEAIPVTKNGKLDKHALLNINVTNEHEYIEPRNELEKVLCECFQEVLCVNKVGVSDSFYELGGDSIKAIRIVSKMRANGYMITVKEIMNRYTIEAIAKVTIKVEVNKYNQGEANGIAIPLPIITKFSEMKMVHLDNFCQDVCIKVEECTEQQVVDAIRALTIHHDVLRAVFKNNVLEILPMGECNECKFIIADLTNREDWEVEMENLCILLCKGFDVLNGSLIQVGFYKTNNGIYVQLSIHHLIVDGVSWRILIEDFTAILNQVKNGKDICIPDKTASYIEWTKKLREYQKTEVFKKRANYWINILDKYDDGDLRIGKKYRNGGYYEKSFIFDEFVTDLLIHKAVKMFNTGVNEIILGALCMAIFKITNQDKIAIMLEGHGRDEIHEDIDISRTVGWFTNLYPVLLGCFECVQDNIVFTKETLKGVPNNGLEYGLIEKGNTKAPDIMFNYLGEMDSDDKTEFLSFKSGDVESENIKLISPLSISAIILRSKIKFTLTYDISRFTNDDIKKLANCYQETLMACIKYCSESENSFLTASDLLKDDIDEDDLDIINSLFADLE